ncbi:unnamed protein product [Candidula unifasciata]|uniref:Glutathione S-transferase 3, mitochondrial n=1 Tax=Candidula unifasciata TaxID=100452 RepID=A0A8S3ZN18_9EUPU|nr:unnamed protein product [Candidula unifasciata]
MATIAVHPDFAYVIYVVLASWLWVGYLTLCVVLARKKYNVPYPTMYSDKCLEFNCIQRAHLNTLEVYPQFLVLLLLGGLHLPKLSAVFGVIYLINRIIFAFGYYTFNPANRRYGAFGFLALVGLAVNTAMFAVNISGSV